jgi:hypothetical protein
MQEYVEYYVGCHCHHNVLTVTLLDRDDLGILIEDAGIRGFVVTVM